MIRLSAQGFDPGAELSRFCAGRRKSGAVASFVGLARDEGGWEEGHGPVLELDAYPGFTETEIANIAREAKSRFSLDDLAVIHRFGAIGPGEPIVLVLTAAGHRREAFEACEFVMDYLKSRAPIWKKEKERWIEPTPSDQEALERWERKK